MMIRLRCSCLTLLLAVAALSLLPTAVRAGETVFPLALFPFQERGREAKELGPQVTDLLFAHLVADAELFLVDREDLQKIMEELELNKSGLVAPAEATQVGHMTGAKILVTGSVLEVGDDRYVIAKIIGTETSRVVGASVKGGVADDLGELVEKLAGEVAETVKKRADDLVAKPVTQEDRLAALGKKMGRGKRPIIFLDVTERHVGQVAIDPAAQTEIALLCTELGFQVIDSGTGSADRADVLLQGEGFSEFASRHGNLISVKARLELKAIDRKTGQLLAIDRHTSVAVDLTEQIAGKNALQDAASNLASRLLPKLTAAPKKSDKQ